MMTTGQDMTFGQWLTEEMKRRDWNITELSAHLGISWQRAKLLATDEPPRSDGSPATPRKETVIKIAEQLGVPSDDALRAAGYLPIPPPIEPGRIGVILREDAPVEAYNADGQTVPVPAQALFDIMRQLANLNEKVDELRKQERREADE